MKSPFFAGWYVYQSQSWVVYDIVLPIVEQFYNTIPNYPDHWYPAMIGASLKTTQAGTRILDFGLFGEAYPRDVTVRYDR